MTEDSSGITANTCQDAWLVQAALTNQKVEARLVAPTFP
jgi:hypothetical protein